MRILVESYEYLFFRLYRWHRKHFGVADLPHLNATLNLGVLVLVNWMTFVMGSEVITDYQIMSFTRTNSIFSIVTIGVIMFVVFFRNQRYKKIIARFEKKELKIGKAMRFLSIAYPLATIVLLFFAIFFAWGINIK